MLNFTILNPESGRAPRIIARDQIDAVAKQFRHQQPLAHLFHQVRKFKLAGCIQDQIVIAASVAGTAQSQLAAGIATEKITLYDAVIDYIAFPCRHPLVVERSAGQAFFQVRLLTDLDIRRKYLTAYAIQKKRRAPVEVSSAHSIYKMADET